MRFVSYGVWAGVYKTLDARAIVVTVVTLVRDVLIPGTKLLNEFEKKMKLKKRYFYDVVGNQNDLGHVADHLRLCVLT